MMIGLGNLGHLGKLGHVSTTGMNQSEASASGRAFPIWNTKPGDDKLMSLSIHGLTEQIRTPTPANPVPMRSVGDMGLLLSVMPDKECSDYQLLNIKAAMKKSGHDGILRSVNGIYDEVVYDGKKWKLIQRIGVSTGFTVTSISTINTNGDLREVLIRGLVKGTQVTPDVSVFYSNKFYYTGDSTSNKWNNVYGVYTNSLRYGFTVVYDITDYPTEEALKAMIEDESTIYYYVLFTPIEYKLDLPVITTYDEQTYFASNAADIKPYMEANVIVSKSVEPIKSGLLWWFELSPANWNNDKIHNKANEQEYLEPKNFAGTPESGSYDNYTQFDGIDDYMIIKTEKRIKSYQILFSDPIIIENRNHWILSDDITTGFDYNQLNWIFNPPNSPNTQYYKNDSPVSSVGLIKDIQDGNKYLFSLSNGDIYKSITLIGTYQKLNYFTSKFKGYALLGYDKEIDTETISQNTKYFQQRFGEDIDGKAEETTASGENGFTVYNSLPGIFKELTVYGKSTQDGTPTPENPIPIKSVGDTPLILTISNGTETQQINFGDIKLRSVGTVSDELVFDNSVGKWKLIQRVKEYSVDDLSTPGNYSFKNWVSGDNVHYAIYYKTPQNDLVSNTNSPFMSDYSDKPFWPGTIQKGVGYYFGQLCFSMLNGETTETEALNITKGRHYQGLLITPIETELDFESPKTFSGEVTVTTNQESVYPYMTARIAVGEKLTLPADPLAVYISGKQTTGDNTFKDQSGNGNDIPLYNLAHSAESGFFQGALHLDGVDDTGRLPLESFNPAITAETSIFLSGKVNETGTKYFSYLRTRDGVSTALSRLIPGNTGLFIAYYPLSLTGNPDVNLLNTYKLTYNNNNMLDQLLSPANKTYYNLAGFLQGGSQVELGKLDYRYLIIYPRNLTKEEQAIVLKYITQGIYEL